MSITCIIIGATYLTALTLFSLVLYKDILCPAVIHNVFFIFAILGCLFFPEKHTVDLLPGIAIICCGSTVFQLMFLWVNNLPIKPVRYSYEPKVLNIKIILWALILLMLPYFVEFGIKFFKTTGTKYSVFWDVKDSSKYNDGLLLYIQSNIPFLFVALLVVFWSIPSFQRKKIRATILAFAIVSIACVLLVPTRSKYLFCFFPIVMCFFITKKIPQRTIIVSLILAFLVFLLIFGLISLSEDKYMYDEGSSELSTLLNIVFTYLSGSVYSLSETWADRSFIHLGKNTFRFFYALLGRTDTVSIVSNFTSFDSFTTNVYTFYDFYIQDFGIGYAMLAQAIVASIHAVAYKLGCKKGSLGAIFITCILFYPLVMQFFMDAYLSLLSTWIQIFFVYLIVFKSGAFFKRIREN